MATPAATDQPTFKYKVKGKETTYKIILQRVHIPGIGVLTATDIASDVEAQKYLVDSGTTGSVIEVVA